MKFRLGTESVIAINDGGLGIRYNTGQGFTDWQPGGIRPILSLEVFHLKSSNILIAGKAKTVEQAR
jgi:hypothetical protein